jgi:3-hydroxyacyl-CoA dehydrogenase
VKPMTNQIVNQTIKNQIGVITINYAPVNALSQIVRQGIVDSIRQFESDDDVKVIILRCEGRTYIAGADIKEFGKPPTEPFLPDVVNIIENSTKPIVTSLFGTSLGGGFEVALACHYRIALDSAKVGMPEVNLGLIPGAGGTQRLPRAIGAQAALDMITSGKHVTAKSLSNHCLFTKIIEDSKNLDEETFSFAQSLITNNQLSPPRLGNALVNDADVDWDAQKLMVTKKARGQNAPLVAFDILFNTKNMDIISGMKYERQQFLLLRESEQSAALRHAFGAEKQAGKLSIDASPLAVEKIGIIGGGNMGSGIATAFLTSGFQLTLIERNQEALDAGLARIKSNFERNVKSGRMSETIASELLDNLNSSTDYASLADADLVLEAVFEDIDVKKTLFSSLDSICKPETIFATNTSYLDIDEIASATNREDKVVGMHFFSPANIMKLLEVVKTANASDQTLATAMDVGKRLKKISVLVGVCFGFAGNRMYTRYGREIQQMLLEGAGIAQIDNAMKSYGMAMGPLAVQDLSGIDIGHNARSAQPFPEHDKGYFRAAATLVENGRLGRKTQAGFYDYDHTGAAKESEQALKLIQSKANELDITQRQFTDNEIVHRAIFALISEGKALLKDGIVQRESDIDVIWLSGYGFPRYKGGPMFQAKCMGNDKVTAELTKLQIAYSEDIWPTT